jgi:hypothetical protein
MINICFEQGDKHKVCGRMKNMKKIALAIAATSILGVSASTQAAIDVCVFDLLGKSGESYKMMQDWAHLPALKLLSATCSSVMAITN